MPGMSFTTFAPPASLGVEVTGSTCILTLDRPQAMNALDMELRRGLGAALVAYQADPALRVAILTGAGGRAFSAGDDLKEMADLASGPDGPSAAAAAGAGSVSDLGGLDGDGDGGSGSGLTGIGSRPRDLTGDGGAAGPHGSGGDGGAGLGGGSGRPAFEVGRLGQVPGFDELRTCRKPVIAAIDGWCLAGGFELAMYSDIRLATQASRFGLPEPRRGLLPGPGLHDLPRMVPLGEALRLLLSGGHMTASRAYEIGLLQGLADDRDDLFAQAHAIAGEIAACAPLSVEAIKRIVHAGRDLPIERAWQIGEPHAERLAATADAAEGVRAFAEKRAPHWQGR
jgi:enoyl-CoA hydratase/carnithine racemase